jgi:hypothetical protein
MHSQNMRCALSDNDFFLQGLPNYKRTPSAVRRTVLQPAVRSALNAGQCPVEVLGGLLGEDAQNFVVSLLSSDPPCGSCLVKCKDAKDALSCALGCIAGGKKPPGVCSIQDFGTIFNAEDKRFAIISMIKTNNNCAACFRSAVLPMTRGTPSRTLPMDECVTVRCHRNVAATNDLGQAPAVCVFVRPNCRVQLCP